MIHMKGWAILSMISMEFQAIFSENEDKNIYPPLQFWIQLEQYNYEEWASFFHI